MCWRSSLLGKSSRFVQSVVILLTAYLIAGMELLYVLFFFFYVMILFILSLIFIFLEKDGLRKKEKRGGGQKGDGSGIWARADDISTN